MGVGAGLYMCDVVKKVHVRYLISWWVLVVVVVVVVVVIQCSAVLFHDVGAGLKLDCLEILPIAVHVGTAKPYISLHDNRGLARSLNCGILASRFSLCKTETFVASARITYTHCMQYTLYNPSVFPCIRHHLTAVELCL